MLIDLDQLFCDTDDFYKVFEQAAQHELLQLPEVQQVDLRSFSLSPSEIMTILIAFHLSN